MEAPSGAGYIPRESVLDNILQLFNTFGADAKKKRAGELGQQSAQTEHLKAQTAEIPNQSAMGWDSHAMQREQMAQQQRQHDDSSGLGWSELNNRQSEFEQRLPILQNESKNDTRRVDAAETQTRLMRDQQDEQNWLNMAKFQHDVKSSDDTFAAHKMQLDQTGKQDQTRDLITMAGQEFDPKRRAALSDNILGTLAPELAVQQEALKKQHALEAEKLLHPELFGLDGQKITTDGLSTPVNTTDPTIRDGGFAGWLKNLQLMGTPEQAAKIHQDNADDPLNPANIFFGKKKPNPNYKPPKETAPPPRGKRTDGPRASGSADSLRFNNTSDLPQADLGIDSNIARYLRVPFHFQP